MYNFLFEEISESKKGLINLTSQQKKVLIYVVGILAILICLKFIKKTIKLIVIGTIVILMLISAKIIPKDTMSNIGNQIKAMQTKYLPEIQNLAKDSKNVTITKDKDVKINTNNEWIEVGDIDSFVEQNGKIVSINVNGKDIKIVDEVVSSVLNLITKGK